MPSITPAFLQLLHEDYRTYPCFIETGTYLGETIFSVEPEFDTLYTIECSAHHYRLTKGRYAGKKINFILGDSSVIFPSLLPNITTKAIFFLDGHWSGGNTGRGEKDCPLVEEVTHIQQFFPHEAILIIDDVRLFGLDASSGKLGEDWSQIHKDTLLSILGPRIREVYSLDSDCAKEDRLVIHITARG